MSPADELRAKAAAFRDRYAYRVGPPAQEDRTRHLASFSRGPDREVRVDWGEYKGVMFLSVRLWFEAQDGSWRPTKEGVTIRPGDLAEFAEAIASAMDLIDVNINNHNGS